MEGLTEIKAVYFVSTRQEHLKKLIKIMTKDNSEEATNQAKTYRDLVNPRIMDIMRDKIVEIVDKQKKYKEKGFSAKRLAGELHTNTRYISAAMRMRFNMNYTSYINKLRVEEATAILADKRFADLKMEDVSFMVGFSNRQSFYTAFARVVGTTPRAYRQKVLTGGQGGD